MYFDLAKELIKRHEGLRLRPYKCTAGFNTIGYGHNLDARGISQKIADELLEEDMQDFVAKAKTYPWFEALDDVRKAVIVDMLYNLGSLDAWPNFQKALASKNWAGACASMKSSLWASQVGTRAVTLIKIMETGVIQ